MKRTLSAEEACVVQWVCGSAACGCARPWAKKGTTATPWATRWDLLWRFLLGRRRSTVCPSFISWTVPDSHLSLKIPLWSGATLKPSFCKIPVWWQMKMEMKSHTSCISPFSSFLSLGKDFTTLVLVCPTCLASPWTRANPNVCHHPRIQTTTSEDQHSSYNICYLHCNYFIAFNACFHYNLFEL